MKTMKYFSATWCGPCKSFKPVMNEIASEGHSVQFIDVDESPDLAQQYNVRSVPTVVILFTTVSCCSSELHTT